MKCSLLIIACIGLIGGAVTASAIEKKSPDVPSPITCRLSGMTNVVELTETEAAEFIGIRKNCVPNSLDVIADPEPHPYIFTYLVLSDNGKSRSATMAFTRYGWSMNWIISDRDADKMAQLISSVDKRLRKNDKGKNKGQTSKNAAP